MRATWSGKSIFLTCETTIDEEWVKVHIGDVPKDGHVDGTARFRATKKAGGYATGENKTTVEIRFK
ncbi:MAG: hypothetical protein AMS21_01025 [Gemmatimonas sp. SG8_38_2]|nr:MAG: hypothetical protein AMS21_01025 [Gemmatimonas sp. SG8_38_2]